MSADTVVIREASGEGAAPVRTRRLRRAGLRRTVLRRRVVRRTTVVAGGPVPGRALLPGRVLTAVGVLLVLVAAFPFIAGPLVHSRAQALLVPELRGLVRQGPVAFDAGLPDGATPVPPAVGSAVALLQVPDLGMEEVVVEGSAPAELTRGPGHLRDSAFPGQPGNVVVLGRRMSYGGPFRELDRLGRGDEVVLTTGQGQFRYRVVRSTVADSGAIGALTSSTDERLLTLVTSDPPLRASARLVVVAELQGQAVAPVRARPRNVDESELGLAGDPGARFLALVWGQLLLLSLAGSFLLFRRWRPWSAYLVTAPVVLALVYATGTAVSRLFPGTL